MKLKNSPKARSKTGRVGPSREPRTRERTWLTKAESDQLGKDLKAALEEVRAELQACRAILGGWRRESVADLSNPVKPIEPGVQETRSTVAETLEEAIEGLRWDIVGEARRETAYYGSEIPGFRRRLRRVGSRPSDQYGEDD